MGQVVAPFGIEFGTSVSSLDVVKDLPPQVHLVRPPRPHPRFDEYLVRETDRLGVVLIKALTAEISHDNDGSKMRRIVDEVAEQLAVRYGPGEAVDWLFSDSKWDEPNDWAMGVVEGDRVYCHRWVRPEVELPGVLSSIYLGVTAIEYDLYVVLEYASTELEAAQAEERESLSDLL